MSTLAAIVICALSVHCIMVAVTLISWLLTLTISRAYAKVDWVWEAKRSRRKKSIPLSCGVQRILEVDDGSDR